MTLKLPAESGTALAWTKSSYSSNEGANCVEAAVASPGQILVRDSKDPAGPMLAFSAASWRAFTGFAAD